MTVPVLPNDVTTETDLLIIGGGSAGLWAANRFKELHPSRSVLIVDKGPQDWGGLMAMAGGDFDAVLPHESIDDWLQDFVYYFDGLCDQEELESVLRISADRLRDYQTCGCEFLTTPDGALKSVPQRGLPHVKLYPAKIKGRGGESMIKPQTGWQALNHDKLRALGMDLFRDNTEWVPQMTISHGGLDADSRGRTSVLGLFAAGTARSTEPGVYAGGFALMTTAATGYLAAEGVSEYLDNAPAVTRFPDPDPVAREALYRPLGAAGLAPKTVLTEIQTVMFPYDVSILKTEAALLRALAAIETIREQRLPAMTAADPHTLMKLREILGVARVSELYLRASLERRETRAGHYREDCPQRDPAMLAWQTVRCSADGRVEHGWRPVPFGSYRFPVTRFYQDNFTFSTPKY